MKQARLTLPEISLLAVTRVALGGGLALLLTDCLTEKQRKAAGWGLFLTGAVSTVPLVKLIIDKRR